MDKENCLQSCCNLQYAAHYKIYTYSYLECGDVNKILSHETGPALGRLDRFGGIRHRAHGGFVQ